MYYLFMIGKAPCEKNSITALGCSLAFRRVAFDLSQYTKVVNELGESLERERHREHDARTVLEGAVSRGGVILPEVIPRPNIVAYHCDTLRYRAFMW